MGAMDQNKYRRLRGAGVSHRQAVAMASGSADFDGAVVDISGKQDAATAATDAELAAAIAGISINGRVHNGTGANPPAGTGKLGDWWVSNDLKKLYGPKSSDTNWGTTQLPAFRGAATYASPKFTLPTGTAVGDLMVLAGDVYGAGIATPTGWQSLGSFANVGTLAGFTRRVTQADLTNGVTMADTAPAWVLVVYSGVAEQDTVKAIGAAAFMDSSTVAVPSVTHAAGSPTKVLYIHGGYGLSATPTGTTNRAGAGGGLAYVYIHEHNDTLAQDATSTPTPSFSANRGHVFAIVIAPGVFIQKRDLPDDYEAVKSDVANLKPRVTTNESDITALKAASTWTKVLDLPLTALTNWVSESGTWTADAGGIHQTTADATTRRLRLDTFTLGAHAVVEVALRIDTSAASTTDNRVGLILGHPEAGGTGGMGVHIRGNPAMSEVYVEQDAVAVTGTKAFTPTVAYGTDVTLRVLYVGADASIFVNGTLITTARSVTAHALRTRLALYSYNTTATWKNLKVWHPNLAGLA